MLDKVSRTMNGVTSMIQSGIPERLRSLRAQFGFSQEALGRAVGVARQTIASWERGETIPTLVELSRLTKVMAVPLEALLGGRDGDDMAVLFRADKPDALTPALRDAVAEKVAVYAEVERLAGQKPAKLPEYPMDTDDPERVEKIAFEMRNWLGLDNDDPVNIAERIEQRGVKVILYNLPNNISGFSAYSNDWGAVIVVNRTHPGERQIFTILHELGHLIFHRQEFGGSYRPSRGNRDPREKAANRFAGAVLLPADLIERELGRWRGQWLPESRLLDLKLRYRVSMRTVVMRAGQLGLISQMQAGQQLGMLDKMFSRNNEPAQLPALKQPPRLRRLVFRALLDREITSSRAAEILGMSVIQVRKEMMASLEDDPE